MAKTKTTRLIDNLVLASEIRSTKTNHPVDTWEQIDEDYEVARFKLQYHIQTLEKKLAKEKRGADAEGQAGEVTNGEA